MTPHVMLIVLVVFVTFMVVRRRPRFALSAAEGLAIGAYAVLGLLQGIAQKQVQLDDYVFTPLYLAIPVWVGARRGAAEGFVATLLGLVALFVVAALHPLDSRVAGSGGGIVFEEWVVAFVVLGTMAGLASVLRRPWWVAGLLPLFWAAFPATFHDELLLGTSPWIAVVLAVAVANAGLLALRAGLVARFGGERAALVVQGGTDVTQ